MKGKLALLLLSAGRRVALMECFRGAASALGIDLRVVAVDLQPEYSAACARADTRFSAPRCTSAEYPEFIKDICAREAIDLVVPTIDTELLPLARLRPALAQLGTEAVISDEAVVRLARDKLETAAALSSAGLPAPRTASAADFDVSDSRWQWPLFLKPRGGSASAGIRTIERSEALALTVGDHFIVQERLFPPEHTINMFFSRGGELQAVVPHLRMEIRAGEVSKAETVRDQALQSLGWRLGAVLKGARGPLCFQAMPNADGEPVIIEINARFGGGYPIAHRAGATFAKWLLEEVSGRESSANDNWRGGVRMLRYDEAVFL